MSPERLIPGKRHSVQLVDRAKLVALTILLYIALPILLVTVLIPLLLLRLVVIVTAKFCRPDLQGILSDGGIVYACETFSVRPRCNIVLQLRFDQVISVERFRSEWKRRVLSLRDGRNFVYRQLRQTWTQYLGFLFWRWDNDFSVNNHVRPYDYTGSQLALPSPCTEKDIQGIMGELLAKPWPMGRSPWEVLIVGRVADPVSPFSEYSVAIFRLNHALCDGYSLLKLFLKFFESEDVKRPLPRFPELSRWQSLVLTLTSVLRMPLDTAAFMLKFYDGTHSWHVGSIRKLSFAYHVFFSEVIPVDQLKTIAKKYSTCYNAAIYAVTIGAIRRMMLQSGQKLPRSMSAAMPVPLPNHPGGLVNHVVGVALRFSPRNSKRPTERIREVADCFQDLRISPTLPLVVGWLYNLCSFLPVYIIRLIISNWAVSMVMTSFPGPEEYLNADLLANKARVKAISAALGHMGGSSGAIAVMVSMAGNQRIILTVDKALFDGYQVPKNFAELVNEEVEALLLDSTRGEPR